MLHRLSIRNYAIIEKLEIEFCDRMNIITGETGAGKSILLGALGLILGERADTKVLYNKEEKCVVEADFEIEDKGLKDFFTRYELDFDTHTIVRREINQSGKTRAFVNDTPVTLAVLKQLGESLVNLHTQHETLELVSAGFQMDVVDKIAKNSKLLHTYQAKFLEYRKQQKELDDLIEQNNTASAESDYLNFQLTELTEAGLKTGEQEGLEAEQSTLSNVEEIKKSVQNAIQILANSEVNILDQVSEVLGSLKHIKNLNKEVNLLSTRLYSVQEELKDLARELDNIHEGVSLDPEKLEATNFRLNTIYRLQKKHNVSSIEELLKIQAELDLKIGYAADNSTVITKLQQSLKLHLEELQLLGAQLHLSREKVLREFQNHVVVLLAKVGMPNALFKVDIHKTQVLNVAGMTELKFLFSGNKGFAPLELKEVASGGELSRLMLCIKSLLADAGALPTLIFDEIDAGISGEVALKTGEIMKTLSRNHQLIAITHLPQIARTADAHLYIYKETRDNRTYTRLKELKGEERIFEIAKMLSGENPTPASVANARELVG